MKFYLYEMQWYRRWKGGSWYHVTPRPYPYIELWTPTGPTLVEKTLRQEVWYDGVDMAYIVKKYTVPQYLNKEERLRADIGGDWDEFISGE